MKILVMQSLLLLSSSLCTFSPSRFYIIPVVILIIIIINITIIVVIVIIILIIIIIITIIFFLIIIVIVIIIITIIISCLNPYPPNRLSSLCRPSSLSLPSCLSYLLPFLIFLLVISLSFSLIVCFILVATVRFEETLSTCKTSIFNTSTEHFIFLTMSTGCDSTK